MSAVPSVEPVPEPGFRRNFPRYVITVPLDVIALRSGIPDSVPGRCTNISEAGIGAAVAGELVVNQHLAIELKLPHVALPLRARAIVRHHTHFHCGLQFVNLSLEQREMIRFWARHNVAQTTETKLLAEISVQNPEQPMPAANSGKHKIRRRLRIRKRHVLALLAVTLVLAACAWWYWEWSWSKLERSVSAATPPMRIADFTSQDQHRDVVILSEAKPLPLQPGKKQVLQRKAVSNRISRLGRMSSPGDL